MTRINPHDLTRTDAEAMLAESLHGADVAAMAAGMARGATRRRCTDIARQHGANALALADRLYGAPSAAVMAMDDAAIMQALSDDLPPLAWEVASDILPPEAWAHARHYGEAR